MPGGKRRVAIVFQMLKDQPWGEAVKRDLTAALGQRSDVALEIADPVGSAAEQAQVLEAALASGVHALVVLPIDPALTRAVLARYRAAGVPVIVVDTDVGDPSLYRALILADNRQLGRAIGEFHVEAMGGEGQLVELRGIAGTASSDDRSAGFREALAAHPRMRILESRHADWMYDRALEEFSRMLERWPRIDGVCAHNDEMARAALDAAARAGREAEMLITGVDALPSTIRLVSQGRLAATFLNPSPGKQAAAALLAVLDGEPCMKRTVLHTSALKSSERIHAWQRQRSPEGRA